MKKFIRWLAKVFKADIVTIKYKDIYKTFDKEVSGSISLDGDLSVNGSIEATKDIVCYKTKTRKL